MGVVVLYLGAGRRAAGGQNVRAAQRLEGVWALGLFQWAALSSRLGRAVEFADVHRLFAAGLRPNDGADLADSGRGALSYERGDESVFRGARRALDGLSVAELLARLQSD